MSLEARGVSSGYGPVTILHDVSVVVPDHGIVAILGPNGAGKTTLLQTLARRLPVSSGSLELDGERCEHRDSVWAARAGVVLVPQTDMVFAELSVRDNLRLGALHAPDPEAGIAATVERFPVLAERAEQSAASLSGGERQLLAIASAVLMKPRFLLLDEPTSGLSPIAAQSTAELIGTLRDDGVGVAWVVEQQPELALEQAERAYVMHGGEVTYAGPARELLERGRMEQVIIQRG